MKKITSYLAVLIIVTIVMFSACSSSDNKTDNSEKLTKFFSNFETLKLPVSSSEMEKNGTIETEYLDILTDTTGGFSRNNPKGKLYFETEYYYVGKLPSENKDYNIIIVGEIPSAAIWGGMEGALLEYKLHTISAQGKIIASVPFAYDSEGENWVLSGTVNENLEIETKLDKTITNYKIGQDGNITKGSETTQENNKEFENFIAGSYKPEKSVFNSDRTRMINEGISEEQLIFIGNEYIPNIDEINCYKPVVFETPNYTTILLTYRDDANELANLLTVDENGKIISQKEEIYFFGGRAESGSIEIELSEDNTMLISCKQVVSKKIGNGTGLTTTFNYYKIDQNGKLSKAEAPLTFTDDRDGKTYKVVKIGDQFWLAENFAYKPQHVKYGGFDGNFWAYDDKDANIEKYGCLYDWATAQNIAPDGWHLPSKEEFETLINNYGDKAFSSLSKELNIVYSGWFYQESMAFAHEGNEVGFWSATKIDNDNAWLCIFEREYEHVFIRKRFMEGVGAGVRLIRDEEKY
ncbi:MAG: hypothetical protein B6I20_04965 [Bacteroidetes bacterium 4572_117]|nr:MAG: hypothetical protein B6I20_04965 [Bacteroidetes bacterium 4572_117]